LDDICAHLEQEWAFENFKNLDQITQNIASANPALYSEPQSKECPYLRALLLIRAGKIQQAAISCRN
jgi:hypothetical protein